MGAMAATTTGAVASVPEKRIALVIGNSKYADAPLVNPANDAILLQNTLKSLGFEVIARTDLDSEGMKSAIRDFGVRLSETPGAAGLFYFAGHGVQIKGVNYLAPIGKIFTSEAEIEDSAINVDLVMRRLQDGKTKIGFVVLDACRNNPFAKAASRSMRSTGGLARMDAPSGVLIAYATAPGSVASDGTGTNGLYTEHLVRSMKMPGISAEQVFKRTREGVEQDSGAAQSPREESSLKGADFHFLPISEARKVNPELVELTYWESIRGSADAGDFRIYLRDYPQGKFASLAKQAVEKLNQKGKTDPAYEQLGQAYAAIARGEPKRAEAIFLKLAESARPEERARGKEGLAEVALQESAFERASLLADEALQARARSVGALLVKAKVAFRKGARDEAAQLLAQATAEDAVSDFPWQMANALIAAGNLQRKDRPDGAVGSYEAALRLDRTNIEALTNLAALVRERGNPQRSLALITQARKEPVVAGDRILAALAYQIQQDIAAQSDTTRQKAIDDSVKDLVVRFKEQKASAPANADAWSTAPLAVSVLGFQDMGASLTGRAGMDALLAQELDRELRARNLVVVDRGLIDKVLAELKLGASNLADPETQLRLGRLTAARFIATGRLMQLGGKDVVTYRVIDTETSQVVLTKTETLGAGLDPIEMAAKLGQLTAAEVQAKYPVRGRLVQIEGDSVVINLGRRNGLQPGDLFRVLGEGKAIEFNGKVIGRKDSSVGVLRVVAVEDQLAFGVPVERAGAWAPNMRITHGRAGPP